jgi:NAD(P)-dependent dehydrogenase (short-subunit alcohol dehydrogenase family)
MKVTNKERTVIITGAASGIGKEAASTLRADGAVVVELDLDWTDAAESGDSLRLSVDVSDPDQVASAFRKIPKDLPPVSGVVLAAGIQQRCPTLELDFADWRRVIGVHLDGSLLVAQAAGKRMEEGGSIVFFSSVAEFFGWPERAAYAAAKAGVSALARTLAVEWASLGIRVNAVALGYVDTPLIAKARERGDLVGDPGEKHALGRMAEVGEIVRPIRFLLSDDASFITGTTLFVDGGFSILK